MSYSAKLKSNYAEKIPLGTLKFHRRCLLMDLHIDSLLIAKLTRFNLCRYHRSLLPRAAFLFHVDIPRLRIGNVGVAFLGLVPKPFGRNGPHIVSMINAAEKLTNELPTYCMMARSAEDVLQAKKEHKTAFMLGLEGATGLDGDPRRIGYFAKRGVRYLGFVHFNGNFAGAPEFGLGAKKNVGLTPHGKILIHECLKENVIIDLAHIGRRGFFDILKLVPENIPVIVSHTGIKCVHEHWRNLDEAQMEGVAATGGVMGIMNSQSFLGGATLQSYIDHILAARDIAGYEHVAIGSDFDGMVIPVRGLEDVSKYPILTASLIDEGVPRYEIKAILGENMLRVLKQIPPKYPISNKK